MILPFFPNPLIYGISFVYGGTNLGVLEGGFLSLPLFVSFHFLFL